MLIFLQSTDSSYTYSLSIGFCLSNPVKLRKMNNRGEAKLTVSIASAAAVAMQALLEAIAIVCSLTTTTMMAGQLPAN